jgi:MSHA biogenesis protein MshJ
MRIPSAIARTITPLAERFDALGLRERGLLFGAAVILICLAWQSWLMDPLTARGRRAQERILEVRQHLSVLAEAGATASDDPLVNAANRNRALKAKQAALDAALRGAAQGYVAPERMTELLRELLARQQGLRLVSLANLPVVSLSQTDEAAAVNARPSQVNPADDHGPFLHPVDIVVEGDYASVVAYLRALEGLSWRIHWQQLELSAGEYPLNRVHMVIGALSLSRDWISV